MIRVVPLLLLALLLPLVPAARVADGPTYTDEGQLQFPEKYRDWIFLTSGLDMSYNPKPNSNSSSKPDGSHEFNNVFVNPEAYRAYQASGHWPQGTELILENRGAEGAKSINKAGRTQSSELTGLEVHVLDAAHASGDGWAFYSFDNKVSARPIARPASCYICHEQHAAVDTTFVQFYPTLTDAAEKHKTWNPAYLKEIHQ